MSRGPGRSTPPALLTKAAVGFSRSTGDYERFAPDVARGYRALGLPESVDLDTVAREELRWWVVRREIGLAAGTAAGESIARLYAALYNVPLDAVGEAGRLRGLAAEVRDRGATADPDGPAGEGAAYWPEVARLLGASYRSLSRAVRLASASARAVCGLALGRPPADEPPGAREERRGDQDLQGVDDQERGHSGGDRTGQVEARRRPSARARRRRR